jgi:hypothetical protein
MDRIEQARAALLEAEGAYLDAIDLGRRADDDEVDDRADDLEDAREAYRRACSADRIGAAVAELRDREKTAAATGNPEDQHQAACAYARLVKLCDHQAPGWGEVLADLYADDDDQAAAAVLAAGARA